jgi:hypothetical protein
MGANLVLAFLFAGLCSLTNASPTLLKPARVWTGNNNDPIHTDWVVLVDGEKIVAAPTHPGAQSRSMQQAMQARAWPRSPVSTRLSMLMAPPKRHSN